MSGAIRQWRVDASNTTKARYQPIFFVPVHMKIEESVRDYGVTAAARSVGKRMEVFPRRRLRCIIQSTGKRPNS